MSYPHPRQRLFDALEDAVQRGVFPGCVAFVECDGATVYHEAHGSLASHAASVVHTVAVERDTVYDLSSLTKVLATTTLWALLVSDGAISLDQPVPPRWSRACPGATLLDLLEHRAGLVAHREFFALIDPFDHEAVLDALARTSPASSVGSATVYSDLGFMILGAWLSDVIRRPLEQAFRDRVAYPLQLDEGVPPRLDYRPLTGGDWLLSELERRIAPTEVYEPVNGVDPSHYRVRHGIAHGVVHDDNAFVMGGVAGHAGLFGTAEAVVEVARAWLQDTLPGLDLAVRDRFWQPFPASGSVRRLGWDGVDVGGSTGGVFSPRAVGHLGFTGCSLWIDPAPPYRIVVLLANAVHPRRKPELMAAFRPRFHRLVADL